MRGGGGAVHIGRAVSGGGSGRVLYVSASGLLAQSADYQWDDTNKRILLAGAVAGTGAIRVANSTGIDFRNVAGDTDHNMIRSSTDGVRVGNVTSGVDLSIVSGGGPNVDIHLTATGAVCVDGPLQVLSDTAELRFGAAGDTKMRRDGAANILSMQDGANAQTFRIYGNTTGAKYLSLHHNGTNAFLDTSSGALLLGGTATEVLPGADGTIGLGSNTLAFTNLSLSSPRITPGSGTGWSLNAAGQVRRLTYKCTVTFAALAAAATTADKTIATLPAKSRVVAVYSDTTTKYIGGAVATCAMILGTSAGGSQLLSSHDVFTNPITRGLADADMGSSMTRAAAIQGGFMPSFTATTIVSVRITTTGANTNALTQGSTTFYIEVEVLP